MAKANYYPELQLSRRVEQPRLVNIKVGGGKFEFEFEHPDAYQFEYVYKHYLVSQQLHHAMQDFSVDFYRECQVLPEQQAKWGNALLITSISISGMESRDMLDQSSEVIVIESGIIFRGLNACWSAPAFVNKHQDTDLNQRIMVLKSLAMECIQNSDNGSMQGEFYGERP